MHSLVCYFDVELADFVLHCPDLRSDIFQNHSLSWLDKNVHANAWLK
jgi:hypothetical protein